MIKYKYLFIASGATPIGNAVRVPDEIIKIVSIFRVIQITLHILPSGGQYKSSVDSIKCAIPTAEKALDNIFSERQSCDQFLNAANLRR